MSKSIPTSILVLASSLACLLVPAIVFADAGVPMLAVVWPLSWTAFIPIVGVEAVIARHAASLSWQRAALASLLANLVSTVVGIPVTWGILALLELLVTGGGQVLGGFDRISGKLLAVTVQSPWLIPYEEDLYWMIPAALLFLLPFFGIASVFVERFVFIQTLKCDKATAILWSWRANLATYGIAMLCVAVWLVVEVTSGKG